MAERTTDPVPRASEGGIGASHPVRAERPIFVGPATEEQFNTLQQAIFPIACWRVEDIRFQFDSSFVLPGARTELRLLADLIDEHTERGVPKGTARRPPLSIFGHADPVGSDDYNKALSGRRAAAIYGLLTRRADIWEELFSGARRFVAPAPGDKWGDPAIEIMRAELKLPKSAPGARLDAAGRQALFLRYMEAICVDASGRPFRVDPVQGFLGRNADSLGKGDLQGCSEFNPVLLFSRAENTAFEQAKDKTARNDANRPNRRVMVLLFRPGSHVKTGVWPCPRVREGTQGCRRRFWSDADQRRAFKEQRREFVATEDTFACRFYQRLSTHSPCERNVGLATLRIRLIDSLHRPMKKEKYVLEVENLRFDDVTDDEGGFVHLIPVAATSATLKLETWTVRLDIVALGGPDEPRGARLRFENLGLAGEGGASEGLAPPEAAGGGDDLFRRATLRFQSMVNLEPDGTLSQETVDKLREVYGS